MVSGVCCFSESGRNGSRTIPTAVPRIPMFRPDLPILTGRLCGHRFPCLYFFGSQTSCYAFFCFRTCSLPVLLSRFSCFDKRMNQMDCPLFDCFLPLSGSGTIAPVTIILSIKTVVHIQSQLPEPKPVSHQTSEWTLLPPPRIFACLVLLIPSLHFVCPVFLSF